MSVSPVYAWIPSALRASLAERIASVTEIPEAPQIHGVTGAPQGIARRCFALRWDDAEIEGPGRTGDQYGVRRRFIVDLLHGADPQDDTRVWDTALDDERAVRLALLTSREDALRAVEHRIRWISVAAPTLEGAGAYRRVSLRFEITTLECPE